MNAFKTFLFIFGLSFAATLLAEGEQNMPLTLKSPDFNHLADIPKKFTCEGHDVSPALSWSGISPQTKSLVLIVDDPDAPDPAHPKMTWVHWLLYNIPPTATGLEQGVAESKLPAGALPGKNDWKKTGYGGPCPPIGKHRYFHKLYALDILLDNLNQPDKAQLEKAMKGHIIDTAELIGTYQKSNR